MSLSKQRIAEMKYHLVRSREMISCMRMLGLPRDFHTEIGFSCINIFPVKKREVTQPGIKVPPRMLPCSCSVLLWALKSRVRWGIKVSSPISRNERAQFYWQLVTTVKGEAEKHFTGEHFFHCFFPYVDDFCVCNCHKIPEFKYI